MSASRAKTPAAAKPLSNVDETYKIRISQRINEFRESDEEILVFPNGLDNQERKYVHELCLKLGLLSKSNGMGTNRFLTVKKPQNIGMGEGGPPVLKLHHACVQELDRYFQANPITQRESDFVWRRGNVPSMLEVAAFNDTAKAKDRRRSNDKGQTVSKTAPAIPPVHPSRRKLPIWSHRDEIVNNIRKSDVTVISGETGSGKSTQVVQYVLDDDAQSSIVCTQPRRLSAMALAERVAEERGEAVGKNIGYSVRFESCLSDDTRCLFCTTGVALSSLRNGLGHSTILGQMTHLFIDEVHERDRNTDFLLIFVRELLVAQNTPTWQGPRIKVILMSATMSVKAFMRYFSECGAVCSTVAVEGSSFTVHPLFLEDVLSHVKDYVKGTLRIGGEPEGPSDTGSFDPEASMALLQQTPKKLRCPLCGMGAKSVEEFGVHAATCQGSLGTASGAKNPDIAKDDQVWEDVWGESTPTASTPVAKPAVEENMWEDVWGSSPTAPTVMDSSVVVNETQREEDDDDEEDLAFRQRRKRGVWLEADGKTWRATLDLDGQIVDLGSFPSKEAAEEKYLKAMGKWSSNEDEADEIERSKHRSNAEIAEAEEMHHADEPEIAMIMDRYLRSREGDEETEADTQLIVALLEQIDLAGSDPSRFFRSQLPGDDRKARDDDASAVLIFLAGWGEITALVDALQAHPKFGNERFYQVLPLHSGIPSKDQRRVFARPPKGCRKIVCATNIAETSLTIEDVVYVIDTGLVKEKGYDSFTKTSSLLPHFVSKASARQRRGRAGRCRTGVCFHLFSRMRFETMIENQLPELLRTPLEEMCLHAKSIIASSKDILPENCTVAAFLLKALDPPSLKSILTAVQTLISLGGFDSAENLTALGHFLCSVPVEPRLGKMILYGAFLQAAAPAVTLSVASGFRDPFVLIANPALKPKATANRIRFARAMRELRCSDHVAVLTCFQEFVQMKTTNGMASAQKYCGDNFLSPTALDSLNNMRRQVASQLRDSPRIAGLFQKQGPDAYVNNAQSMSPAVLSALICSATFPNFAVLRKQRWTCGGHRRIRTHPSSALIPPILKDQFNSDQEDRFFVFEELIRNSKGCTIRVVTSVDPIVLMLFGGSLNLFGASSNADEDDSFGLCEAGPNKTEIKLNSWAKLVANKEQAERLAVLRLRFELSFMAGIERGFFANKDREMAMTLCRVMNAQVMGTAPMHHPGLTSPPSGAVTRGAPRKPSVTPIAAAPAPKVHTIAKPARPGLQGVPSTQQGPAAKTAPAKKSTAAGKPLANTPLRVKPATAVAQQPRGVKPEGEGKTPKPKLFCHFCNKVGHTWHGGCRKFETLPADEKAYFNGLLELEKKRAATAGEST